MSNFLIITFLICLLAILIFHVISSKFGLIDIPNQRSSHNCATPSSAGIPIFTTFFLVTLVFAPKLYNSYMLSLLGAALIFILGILDDVYEVRARYKIIVIALATGLSCFNGVIIENIGTYFDFIIELKWLAIPLTIFSVIGFTNSFNLIDGVDGLAGTIGIVILASLWYVGFRNNDYVLQELASLIIPALCAFLVFNWNPAKIFMGDSGSLTLGFIISILSIKALEYIPPAVVLYLVAIPVIDTFVVICRRIRYGKSIFSPDKNHFHHVFLYLFSGNVKKTVFIIVLMQIAYTSFGLLFAGVMSQEALLVIFIVNIISWYFILINLSENHAQSVVERKHKSINNAF